MLSWIWVPQPGVEPSARRLRPVTHHFTSLSFRCIQKDAQKVSPRSSTLAFFAGSSESSIMIDASMRA